MTIIEIDGKKCEAVPGAMIIEVADQEGIRIPRFCFHKKLHIAANCRMCLVQVEKVGKPVPACATPVTEGMVVHTQSKMALDAQRSVMEFLLINHPLDCPVCDQGGECELQDLAMGYGDDISRFHEGKRAVQDQDIGPLIETEMTRCIHCTRCVRFGSEIAGLRELGATGRGEHMQIETFLTSSVDSELSGNVIDLCPVGALTSKPYRFSTRAWQLKRYASISSHDCLGGNLYFHLHNDEVKRAVPRENEAVNEVWLSDRDRFSYEAFRSEDRLQHPMIKEKGEWVVCDWVQAFQKAAAIFRQTIEKYGPTKLATLLSPSSTTEEAYLIQKMMRELGCENIDHRIWQADFRDDEARGLFPYLGMDIADIEGQDTILIVGSYLRKTIPLLNHRIRKAQLAGANVYAVNPARFDFNFDMNEVLIPAQADLVQGLAEILKAISVQKPLSGDASKLIKNIIPSQAAEVIAKALLAGDKKYILLGEYVETDANASELRYLAQAISEATGAIWGEVTFGANSAGAFLAGALPHRSAGGQLVKKPGLNFSQMLKDQIKAFFLFGITPEEEGIQRLAFQQALKSAEGVVACAAFMTPFLKETATVILPIGLFSETGGSFVNIAGLLQSFTGAMLPPGEARPGWKVLRVLGNVLHLPGFEFNDVQAVLAELKTHLPQVLKSTATYAAPDGLSLKEAGITPVPLFSLYHSDAITRRAPSLQATLDAKKAMQTPLAFNETLAQKLKLKTGQAVQLKIGQQQLSLPCKVDNSIADNAVMLSLAVLEVDTLTAAVELQGG